VRLIDIYSDGRGERLAYELLKERPLEHGISHKRMPTWEEHLHFMHSAPHPFRLWLVIETDDFNARDPRLARQVPVGVIEVLPSNEFGVHVLKRYQGHGIGRSAVELFIKTHEPLPPIPAVRNGRWLANVAPANKRAAEFFQKLGFTKIQETYAL